MLVSDRDVVVDLPGAGSAGPDAIRVSVVIPTLDEAANLPYVFDRLPADVYEVILVDGGSTDGTVDVARRLRPDVRVLHQTGRGKGNALREGFTACRGDVVVTLDADGSTDPAEIPRFVRALADGADFAKGSRFMVGGGSSDITGFRRRGNRLLRATVNSLYRTRYTDLCYGYNAFWARHVALLTADAVVRADGAARMRLGDGFEIETLMNVRVAAAGLRVVEVPSFEGERIHGVSRLNALRDGARAVVVIGRERLGRRAGARRIPSAVASTDGRSTDLAAAAGASRDGASPDGGCPEHVPAWVCCCPAEVAG